jgi:hypothetical protein
MGGHGLGVLERSARLELGGDAYRTKGVATEFGLDARAGRTAADHPIDVEGIVAKRLADPTIHV